MTPTFAFTVDASRSLVRITMSGFFNPCDIARFAAVRDAAHQQLRCAKNAHVTLVDIRGMHIQSQESVAGFAALLAKPDTASKRIAFVVTQSLARLQIQRAAAGRGAEAGFFSEDVRAAERWLFSETASSA